MQRRADEGLAYLIRLCGYKGVESLVHEKEMMSELFILMNEIETRALSDFRLTLSEIEIPHRDFVEVEKAANPINADDPKLCSKMEEFLNENLSNNKVVYGYI